MSKIKHREPGKIVGHQGRQLFPDMATRQYVDSHLEALRTGVLKHAVVDILNTPPDPATAPAGSLYIVGANPTGAWAGLANQVAMLVPPMGAGLTPSWASFAPADKEERLVESKKAIYQYQAATTSWEELAIASATPGEYPKVVHYWQLDGTASGTLSSTTVLMKTNHIYQVTGYVGANYDNDSDRFQVGLLRNNSEVAHVQSVTIGSVYKSGCNIVYHEKHTGVDMGITWELRLLWHSAGVLLNHNQFVITDLGPHA